MYIPKHFEWKNDPDGIKAFMQAHPFALLVTGRGIPLATHLPFHVMEKDGRLKLTAHLSKANPQWKELERGEVLVVFSGPHAYISPGLYDHSQNVPTWNYLAVHVYGDIKIIEKTAEGLNILEQMIAQSEPAYMEQWKTLSEDYRMNLFKGIVPFEMEVTRIDAKQKLSQNKTKGERSRIAASLEKSEFQEEQDLAAYMKRTENQ